MNDYKPDPLYPFPEDHLMNAEFFQFNLSKLIHQMKHSHSWSHGELNAIILLNRPDKQIVLTALHEGTEIISLHSNDSITVRVIEGKIKFRTRKESVTLHKGHLLTLQRNIKYRLISKEETVFLLTIENDSLQRVAN